MADRPAPRTGASGVRVVNSRSVNGVRLLRSSIHSSTTRRARLDVNSVPSWVHETAMARCPLYSDTSVSIGTAAARSTRISVGDMLVLAHAA